MGNCSVLIAVGLREHGRGTDKEQVCLRSQYLGLRRHDREHLGEQLRNRFVFVLSTYVLEDMIGNI